VDEGERLFHDFIVANRRGEGFDLMCHGLNLGKPAGSNHPILALPKSF
jgi:hypothetical protein